MNKKIALLSFSGGLPVAVMDSLSRQNIVPFVVGFTEFPTALQADIWVSLGQIGALFHALKTHDITHICLVGKLSRPALWRLRFDWTGIKTALNIISKLRMGDDGLLRHVVNVFETSGFSPLSVRDICPDLLMGQGVWTQKNPSDSELLSIKTAAYILNDLSKHDIGQSVAICGGVVLALEALEGTDAMIIRCKDIESKRKNMLPPPILVKSAKVGQTPYADLPVFGVQTVENLAQSGFSGAALGAGSVLLIDAELVIKTADKYGLFLYGFNHETV